MWACGLLLVAFPFVVVWVVCLLGSCCLVLYLLVWLLVAWCCLDAVFDVWADCVLLPFD